MNEHVLAADDERAKLLEVGDEEILFEWIAAMPIGAVWKLLMHTGAGTGPLKTSVSPSVMDTISGLEAWTHRGFVQTAGIGLSTWDAQVSGKNIASDETFGTIVNAVTTDLEEAAATRLRNALVASLEFSRGLGEDYMYRSRNVRDTTVAAYRRSDPSAFLEAVRDWYGDQEADREAFEIERTRERASNALSSMGEFAEGFFALPRRDRDEMLRRRKSELVDRMADTERRDVEEQNAVLVTALAYSGTGDLAGALDMADLVLCSGRTGPRTEELKRRYAGWTVRRVRELDTVERRLEAVDRALDRGVDFDAHTFSRIVRTAPNQPDVDQMYDGMVERGFSPDGDVMAWMVHTASGSERKNAWLSEASERGLSTTLLRQAAIRHAPDFKTALDRARTHLEADDFDGEYELSYLLKHAESADEAERAVELFRSHGRAITSVHRNMLRFHADFARVLTEVEETLSTGQPIGLYLLKSLLASAETLDDLKRAWEMVIRHDVEVPEECDAALCRNLNGTAEAQFAIDWIRDGGRDPNSYAVGNLAKSLARRFDAQTVLSIFKKWEDDLGVFLGHRPFHLALTEYRKVGNGRDSLTLVLQWPDQKSGYDTLMRDVGFTRAFLDEAEAADLGLDWRRDHARALVFALLDDREGARDAAERALGRAAHAPDTRLSDTAHPHTLGQLRGLRDSTHPAFDYGHDYRKSREQYVQSLKRKYGSAFDMDLIGQAKWSDIYEGEIAAAD